MHVVGLNIGYRDYAVETAALAEGGLTFQHVDRFADIEDRSKVRAIMVRQETIDADMIDSLPVLEVIQRYGVGVDNVDIDAASRKGIKVCNTPDYGQDQEVSDHAVGLYLALSRRLLTRDMDVRSGVWGVDQKEPIRGHRAATLGLIGFGRIAKQTWARFNALGFSRCFVSDPAVSSADAKMFGVEIAPLDDMFAKADVISLHCPLIPATHHIVDEAALHKMKPSAFVINVSRGGLIDEIALTHALEDGQIAGAALDVFENEPPDPSDPIFMAPNTILTDHMAWYSEASVHALQHAAASEVSRVLAGQAPLYAVN